MTANPLGPGGWEIDATHFPRPPSPIARDLYTRVFPGGLAAGFGAMGILLETLQFRAAENGFLYTQPKVVGAPAGSAPPPDFVLWAIARLHPALRARTRRMAEVFETRAWRLDAETFASTVRPELVTRHRGLLAEDPASMDLPALADHVARCHAALERAVWLHGRYTVSCQIPMGDFVAQARAWTGRSASELLTLVGGHAPVSAGLSEELAALVSALRAHPVDLDADDATGTLDRLRAAAAPVGPAAADWIDLVGWRTLAQYDVAEPVAGDYPVLLVATLRAALDGRLRSVRVDPVAHALVRDAVPDAHRDTFDALLAEAWAVSPLRDERSLYADYWASGILRRAVLAAGRRLGLPPEHVCHGTLPEILEALAGTARPSAALLAERHAARRAGAEAAAPSFGTVSPPPPAHLFPAPSARGMRAAGAVLDALFGDAPDAGDGIAGFPVSAGRYTGPVRRITGPDDFHHLRPGDVLVTTMTSPVYNVVLPMLGALVTDRGGALSHAAVVSREFGIPGVVGCRNATARLVDGQRVTVDGGAGTVTVHGAP